MEREMKYGSVCSGIEAATAAWHGLGWQPSFFSEIEPFPRAVLTHHYPHVPLHGDFTTIKGNEYGAIDLLVGGTPCQSFSIAGLRGGLDDDRGNLALEFLRLADRTRPRWLVWENVPGVLSSNEGRDFGSILGGMVELGYGIAYRVLDAQYFGVAQRRRRVFVVGYLGDWARAAAVLFERHSLQGHPAPRREAGQKPAPTISARPTGGGGLGTDFDLDGGLVHAPAVTAARMVAFGEYQDDGMASTLKSRDYKDATDLVAHSLRGDGFDASEDGTGRGTPLAPCVSSGHGWWSESDGAAQTLRAQDSITKADTLVPVAFTARDYGNDATTNLAPTMRSLSKGADGHQSGAHGLAVAFAQNTRDEVREMPVIGALAAQPGMKQTSYVRTAMQVRRLTPRECERLQGFPDDYTLVPNRGKPAADGPRYKALGNSMAVPVMRWIGERIAKMEALS
jgi:DNA (cytosine-5)-methyltransferase 1